MSQVRLAGVVALFALSSGVAIGGETSSAVEDEVSADAELSEALPEALTEAIGLYRAQKPLSASVRLAELMASGEVTEHTVLMTFYLARCMRELGLLEVAQQDYLSVIAYGPSTPYFKYSIPKAISISIAAGEVLDIVEVIPEVPAEAYPKQLKSHLSYLSGLDAYAADQLSEAQEYFGAVDADSYLYLNARYYDGLIQAESGHLKSSAKAYREVIQGVREVDVYDERALTEVERLQDLSLMNIGRIYYTIDRSEEAITYYELVPAGAGVAEAVAVESAWTQVRLGETRAATSALRSVRRVAYLPERDLLAAHLKYSRCDLKKAESLAATFHARHTAFQGWLQSFSESASEAAAWAAHQEGLRQGDDNALALEALMSATSYQAMLTHLDKIDAERTLAGEQPGAWQEALGARVEASLSEAQRRYEAQAGRALIERAQQEGAYLAGRLQQLAEVRQAAESGACVVGETEGLSLAPSSLPLSDRL